MGHAAVKIVTERKKYPRRKVTAADYIPGTKKLKHPYKPGRKAGGHNQISLKNIQNNPPIQAPEKNVAKENLLRKIFSVRDAHEAVMPTELPKGNEVEAKIIAAENAPPAPTPEEINTENPPLTENNNEPKIRPDYKPGTDREAILINEMLVPFIAKKFAKKNVKQSQLTEDQIEAMQAVKPAEELLKPSWAAYFGTAALFVFQNILQAESVKKIIKNIAKNTDQDISKSMRFCPVCGLPLTVTYNTEGAKPDVVCDQCQQKYQ